MKNLIDQLMSIITKPKTVAKLYAFAAGMVALYLNANFGTDLGVDPEMAATLDRVILALTGAGLWAVPNAKS